MLISHKRHTDTIQVYSMTVMTHVKALQAGHSSQGTFEPITPGPLCVAQLLLFDALPTDYNVKINIALRDIIIYCFSNTKFLGGYGAWFRHCYAAAASTDTSLFS